MKAAQTSLWDLVRASTQIDPDDLAQALESESGRGELDFRTRLLIRDGIDALEQKWGPERVGGWLGSSPAGKQLQRLRLVEMGQRGFPSLEHRLMETTRRETVLQFLRDLGTRLSEPQKITIGGAFALVLEAGLSRHTEDIDVVDEVPAGLREHPEWLGSLASRYGLHLTHFQSHYLPVGWAGRVHSLGLFGQLQVFVVDALDVLVGKLFSAREKDLDDLRMLLPKVDKTQFVERLRSAGATFVAEERLHPNAQRNWYILYGETLPSS
jgi:hypothetical protein